MKIFLHGLESSSRGAKASFLRQLHPDMLVPDFTGGLAERLEKLNGILAGRQGIILVGSSFGGLMAVIYAMENQEAVERLVLLAPALNFPEFSKYAILPLEAPARLIIGSRDMVTPPALVVPVARKIFTRLQYQEVDDDHLLAETFRNLDWPMLLNG